MSKERLKCKDFYIVKFRYYPDEKFRRMDRDSKEYNEAVWKRAREFNDFKDKVINKLTNLNPEQWNWKYGPFEIECFAEYLEATYGIHYECVGKHYQFWIPRKHKEIFDWLIANTTVPYKVLKKDSMGNISNPYRKIDLTHWRTYAVDNNKKKLTGDNSEMYVKIFKEANVTFDEI